MESSSETSLSDGVPKKSSLDDLSKEELVAKCKGLLILAQKAKQAKTEIQNEVEDYKTMLEKCKADKKHNDNSLQILQELVDSLTEQKLNYITEADLAQSKARALKIQCDKFSEEVEKYKSEMIQKNDQIADLIKKLSDYDNEVISLKRQNSRLEEENDQVISQLTEMEARAAEFNAIGLQQREQLQMLEEKAKTENSYEARVGELNNKIQELQNKLQSNELTIFDFENKNIEVTQMYETEKVKKEKANVKLRIYRDKILKCAACINQLKNSRFILSKTVKEYSESIPKWQKDIMKASKVLESQLNELNNDKMLLKERIQQLENELKCVNKDNIKSFELYDENQSLQNELSNFRVQVQADTQAIDHLSSQIKALESEKAILVKEKFNARDNVVELENQNKMLVDQAYKLKSDIKILTAKIDTLTEEKLTLEANHKNEKESLNKNLKCELMEIQEKYDFLKKECDDMQDLNGLLKEEVETLKLSLEQPHDDYENSSDLNVSLQADIVKLEAKLSAYKQENAALLVEIKESRHKIKEFDSLTAEYAQVKSKLAGYKTENTELLNEMKEINQVLKERGESISKLQKAVSEMERLIETLEKDRDNVNQEKDVLYNKIGSLEDDLKKAELKSIDNQLVLERDNALKGVSVKDNIIASLKDEIEKLKHQHHTSVTELPSEDMSTSTISKAEEHSRMKDLDETFEEKYTKLRVFALKLKKKLNESTAQLQNAEQDKARLEKLLNDNAGDAETATITLSSSENSSKTTIYEGKGTTDLEDKLRAATDLTQELSAGLEHAKAEIANKTKELEAEVEAHKQTKDSLDKARHDAKKKSVLSLEIEDYERSMKELTTKMEDSKKKMVQMESTIDTQESTITAMRTQIKLLEEQIRTEDNHIRMIKEELQQAVEESKEKDNVIAIKNGLITKIERDLEDEKRKNEEADLEMTTLIGEKEKVIMNLGVEKTELYNKLKRVEFKSAELTERLKISTIELADLKTEYTSYKVRAQAVLRQNQTIDHSQEEQLKEEAAALQTLIDTLTSKLVSAQQQCEEHTAEMEACRRRAAEAGGEVTRAQQRTARLQADLMRLGQQLDSERAQHKLQISTLTQCYKNQITEVETKYHKEVEAYRKQLLAAQEDTKAVKITSALDVANRNQYMMPVIPKEDGSEGEMDINVSMIPREEGEGSESAPSSPPSKSYLTGAGGSRSPVPLERLLEEGVPENDSLDTSSLGLTPDQEISDLKRKLQAQHQRVKHVTLLLSESERECARMSQLSELLKAELRRVRGSTQHTHNTEYMKNVTLKFLTLPPGDERSRLVPVLQKILTLSNEETNKIHAVAKGLDPNPSKSWGSYLPWPGAKS